MDQLAAEFGHSTYTSFPVIVARLLLATLFGAAIGFEREWRKRPAGLRTHMLVCIAAASYAILTTEIMHAPMFGGDTAQFDPIRVVEAVTAGVAFLAAGVVIFTRGEIHGLTTGAGMWLAGAIGVACGLGLWQIATLATVLALIVLGLLHAFEDRLQRDGDTPYGLSEDELASASQDGKAMSAPLKTDKDQRPGRPSKSSKAATSSAKRR